MDSLLVGDYSGVMIPVKPWLLVESRYHPAIRFPEMALMEVPMVARGWSIVVNSCPL